MKRWFVWCDEGAESVMRWRACGGACPFLGWVEQVEREGWQMKRREWIELMGHQEGRLVVEIWLWVVVARAVVGIAAADIEAIAVVVDVQGMVVAAAGAVDVHIEAVVEVYHFEGQVAE